MGGQALKRGHTALEADGTHLGASQARTARQQPGQRERGEAWRIEDHVCRACFSRVLSRPGDVGRIYRCSGCGTEAVGHAPSSICACGLKLKNGRDLGVRCVLNEAPSPEAPLQVVARQVVT